MAREGPMPMMRGATPAMVAPQNLARMGWLRERALERFIMRMAAAGGEMMSQYEVGWRRRGKKVSI